MKRISVMLVVVMAAVLALTAAAGCPAGNHQLPELFVQR